jgi:uncharacterized membrane protein SirB2
MDYLAIRSIHVTAAALSVTLFAWRGMRLVPEPPRPTARVWRVLPHVVDTVLLASALWLAWQLGVAGTRGWLWAKVAGLLAYIILGTVALRRGRTARVRGIAFAAALAVFAYIVSVALTKSPLGFFAP